MSHPEGNSPAEVQELTLFPCAKVNLGLLIKGKREDGYHLLETLLYPLPEIADQLTLQPHPEPGCHLSLSGIEVEGKPSDNLCIRAYDLLKGIRPQLAGVSLHLHKKIPTGAGLGGGSSDAAATLKGLNELFDLGVEMSQLAELAARLGADVPFFLYDQPMMAQGIGTELSPFPVNLPGKLKVVTSEIHSSTVAAYKALDIEQCNPKRDLAQMLSLPPSQWKEGLINDLEKPVFEMYPELAKTKASLYDQGAIYAAMSGSGSAVFGIF